MLLAACGGRQQPVYKPGKWETRAIADGLPDRMIVAAQKCDKRETGGLFAVGCIELGSHYSLNDDLDTAREIYADGCKVKNVFLSTGSMCAMLRNLGGE